MKFSRWLGLIGVLVGIGLLQVAWHNAVYFAGYGIGDRLRRVHTMEREVAWLDTQVTGLGSPVRLADVAQQRQLTLVAWSTMPASTAIPALHDAGGSGSSRGADAATPAPASADEQTTD